MQKEVVKMGFFRTLLRIITFGMLGKRREPEEELIRKKIEKQQREAATKQLKEKEAKLKPKK